VARSPLLAISALALMLAGPARPAAGAGFAHAALDSVLVRVLRDGRVDYGALLRDHADLDRYLAALEIAEPDAWPRGEQIAFWVNAYNARVLEGVLRRPGLKSVLDVRKVLGVPTLGFFRERRVTAGARRSLDDIEHRILRRRYAEPRVHFVVNCASVSCPVLPGRALTAATLEADLEAATRSFLADTTRNRLDRDGTIRVSMIFKWYAKDFEANAGSVGEFLRRHWPVGGQPPETLDLGYLEYDWSLNGTW
jgi:hypothetical protein